MAACEIIDFKCIFINEIAGSFLIAFLIFIILYFVAASRLKIGFDTTIFFLFPILVIYSVTVGGFALVFAFVTFAGILLIGWIINKQFGN